MRCIVRLSQTLQVPMAAAPPAAGQADGIVSTLLVGIGEAATRQGIPIYSRDADFRARPHRFHGAS